MSPKKRYKQQSEQFSKPEPGNFISEWFGHRVYPVVSTNPKMLLDQNQARCPFLSDATGENRQCVKTPASKGVCTVNSIGNALRQDWLVCPYRALEPSLLQNCIHRLFRINADASVLILPAPTLQKEAVRQQLLLALSIGNRVFIFFQDKLGGEISIAPTKRSPELSFDITIVEITNTGKLDVGQYGILEVQTMDYHGTYKYAVKNLEDALRLHRSEFPTALSNHAEWLSDHVEGPNLSNVFKRTFYQMMFKFQLGIDSNCAGCVLAIPTSVWGSWQKHLGQPDLQPKDDGSYVLVKPQAPELISPLNESENSTMKERNEIYSSVNTPSREKLSSITDRAIAWIYVFDIVPSSETTPNPIRIDRIISTDAASFSYFALQVAPEAAINTSIASLPITLRRRLATLWDVFAT